MGRSLPGIWQRKVKPGKFWRGCETMIANYGYKDGSGDYFISIDTQKCVACGNKPCLAACPVNVLEKFLDDYNDEVVGVRGEHRRKLKYSCALCKPASGERKLTCRLACSYDAINHSW